MSRATGDSSSTEQGVLFVHLSRARKHLEAERYDLARSELELAQIARPNDEDVLNLLSVIEFKRGYYNEAAQAARELLKNNPASAILHSNLGLILFKAGVLSEAEQQLRRALELQPDHVRSHLYLGLLYRMRGKLGLALEHLRFAGARKVVAEIEETLRRGLRDPASRPPPPSTPRPASSPVDSGPAVSAAVVAGMAPDHAGAAPTALAVLAPGALPASDSFAQGLRAPAGAPAGTASSVRLPAPAAAAPGFPARFPEPEAEPVLSAVAPLASYPQGREDRPDTRVSPGERPPAPPPRIFAAKEERGPFPEAEAGAVPEIAGAEGIFLERAEADSRPLFHVRPDGGLEVSSDGVVFVRKGSVVWYSGKLRFSQEASFRGSRLEKILRAEGRGHLFVNDPGRQAFQRVLAGHSLFLEGSRVLALDHGLSFRLEPIHDFRMNRRVDILKIQGTGSVILSVGGPLLTHEVSPELPLNVSSRDLVAWTGELVPSVLEDRFLEEVMMPDVGSAPKLRFEGTGSVLTEPPRPRRRASDIARAGDSDRRG